MPGAGMPSARHQQNAHIKAYLRACSGKEEVCRASYISGNICRIAFIGEAE